MRFLCFFLIFSFISCTLPKTSMTVASSPRDSLYYWDFFEKFYKNNLTKNEIQNEFGNPREINREDKKFKNEVWIYDNAVEKYQEWAFGFNDEGKLSYVIYMPTDTKSFTLGEIERRWSTFKCERKLKETLKPGLIKKTRYLVCDNEKRIVEYNKYEEIFSVRLKK